MTPAPLWRAKPLGWRDRERVIALGEEFGPGGPMVLDVLEEFAKEQRDEDAAIRTGLRALARAAFLGGGSEGVEQARTILRFASDVGAIDELEISDDRDLTVRCRVSGFVDDQGRGGEAIRKSKYRGTLSHQTGQCPEEGDNVPLCPSTEQDITEEAKASSSEIGKASPDAIRLSHLLADLIRQRDPKAKCKPDGDAWLRAMRLLLADRDGDVAEVERVLRWSQADSFWQTNILSPGKLREKFTQLVQRAAGANVTPIRPGVDPEYEALRERRAAAMERELERSQGVVA